MRTLEYRSSYDTKQRAHVLVLHIAFNAPPDALARAHATLPRCEHAVLKFSVMRNVHFRGAEFASPPPREKGSEGGRAGGRAVYQWLAAGCDPFPRLLERRQRAASAPGKGVVCSPAHGRAQAWAASDELGMQCMQTGSLVQKTRARQRQSTLEGISGTERRLKRSRRGLARITSSLHRSTTSYLHKSTVAQTGSG